MSENGFKVGFLPSVGPRTVVGADDEVTFYFMGVTLYVDHINGAFSIREANRSDVLFQHNISTVTTGCIDKKGKYTFSELSAFGKKLKNDDDDTRQEHHFDDVNYFRNEIACVLQQRKVRVYDR